MVGNAEQDQDHRLPAGTGQHLLGRRHRRPAPEGQDAAVERKADDGFQDRLRGAVDGHLIGQPGQQRRHRGDPLFRQEE